MLMKRYLMLLFLSGAVFSFAGGRQETIVTENFSSESRNVVITIVNSTEADFQTLVLTRKDDVTDKVEQTSRRTFSLRSGEAKSVVLDNQGMYKIELYDAKGHKYSKSNVRSQKITDKQGNVISEGEYQQFPQSWQKLVFTDQDFDPLSALDIVEVFFGLYGNEIHEEAPSKTCAVMIVNNTGESVEYISVVQEGTLRTSNLELAKGQSGVLDIQRSETADISLISRSQHVFSKAELVFDAENLTIVFTASDRENDREKASRFVSTAMSNISSALSVTAHAFSSLFSQKDETMEFEPVGSSAAESKAFTVSAGYEADEVSPVEQEGQTEEKSWWSFLPWVD